MVGPEREMGRSRIRLPELSSGWALYLVSGSIEFQYKGSVASNGHAPLIFCPSETTILRRQHSLCNRVLEGVFPNDWVSEDTLYK